MTNFKRICPICGSPAIRHICLGRVCFCSDECKQKWMHYRLSESGIRLGLNTPLFKYVKGVCSKRNNDSCFDRCSICGKLFIPKFDDDREYHHIIPLEIGGNNLPENIALLCHHCHESVHSFPSDYPDYIKPTKTYSNIEDIVNECLVISDYRGEIHRCLLYFIVSNSTPHIINYMIKVWGVDTDKKHSFDHAYKRLGFEYVHRYYCNILDDGKYSIDECKQVFNSFNEIVLSSGSIRGDVVFTSDVREVDNDFICCIDNWIDDLNKNLCRQYLVRWVIKPNVLRSA